MAPRLVDEVGAEIHDAVEPAGADAAAGRAGVLAFAAHAVLLDAEGIHREKQGAAVVVVGVEENLDLVVGVDIVAIGERGAHHRAVGLVGPDAEVDRIGCVPHERDRRVRRGAAVDGAVLGEAGEPRGLPPDGLAQDAVDDDRRLETRRADAELAGAAVVDGARAITALEKGEGEEGGNHMTKLQPGNEKGETGNVGDSSPRFPFLASRVPAIRRFVG